MEEDDGIIDMLHHLAVVVDDDDIAAGLVDLPAFQDGGDVGIHHHQQGIAGNRIQRLRR